MYRHRQPVRMGRFELNVGGTVFATSTSTLEAGGVYFRRLLSGDFNDTADGRLRAALQRHTDNILAGDSGPALDAGGIPRGAR